MFFSSVATDDCARAYDEVLYIAQQAEALGFTSVWLPERHFHRFGGLFPNPSVLGAAVARVTERIAIRAGSVVVPLHDPLRIAEEWAMVDALSRGRAGLSVATGWSPVDFVLRPDRYEQRRQDAWDGVDTLRRLWRGEPVERPTGDGRTVEVSVMPRPTQAELPLWVTSSGSRESVVKAASAGAHLLTHLVDQDTDSLRAAIELYRKEFRGQGDGHVTVMLHAYADVSRARALDVATEPLRGYLRSALQLEQLAHGIPAAEQMVDEELLDISLERYLERSSLIGDVSTCAATVARLADIGVDEVACLVDFGVPFEAIVPSLGLLAGLKNLPEGSTP
ncbi:MupA/Atu3671 family FMN-dependent luciferase-like monooxygenase [Streptomyces sp. NPDC058398]|uniref:MupA/Atu3671 family FMN-dependent luciferase-like monooxygenase n=1 Tax=Streptomyces sp. NPDC058398 TaxID=3346479 RepID=UPI00365644AD